MLVEEAVEKLVRARDTADENERIELIDEVITALEEGKIEPADKKKKLKLLFYGNIEKLKDKEIEITGNPIIVPFPAYEGATADFIAIFEVVEE